MIGTGTLANTGAILVGGCAGAILHNGIPDKYKAIILQGVALAVGVIGLSGTMQAMLSLQKDGSLGRSYIMIVIFSLLIGGVCGEFLRLEDRLEHLGLWLQGRVKGSGGVAEGFVAATLLFCVGAMSIVGSIQDGLTGNASTLYAKSVLDGVISVVFASSMGWGVPFAAIPILLYQGSITLLAGVLRPWLTASVIAQISAVGNVLIVGISINMLFPKKIRIGNLVPAVLVPFFYYLLTLLWKALLFG